MDMNSLMQRMFRTVDNAVIDLTTGGLGLKRGNGEIVSYKDGSINIQVIPDLSMTIPAFAQVVPLSQIQEGDVAFDGAKIVGFIKEVEQCGIDTYALKVITAEGMVVEWVPPVVTMFGNTGAMVLRSFITGSGSGFGDMNPMMLAMLLKDGGSSDNKNLLMAMMLGGGGIGGGSAGQMNPLMLAMLMKDGGKLFG